MSRGSLTADDCIFCRIIAGRAEASVVFEDALAMAFMDLRQFNHGHVLVVPKAHLADIRDLDDETGTALILALANVTRAVSSALSCNDLSVWHSIGEAGGQEVPHLHFHVHPRKRSDGMFAVYPSPPGTPERSVLDALAATIARELPRPAAWAASQKDIP